MKTKNQLIQIKFIFTTNLNGLISARLLDKNMNSIFSTKAKSMTTIRRKITNYLNNQLL